jgi:hypothetical protein
LPSAYTAIEIGREAATLVMLAAVGWAAGRRWADRVGHSLVAFGVWDIFYYVWLAVLVGWPQSLFDWDLLFLIPLPWWGPVLSPVLISLLLIAAGTLAVLAAAQGRRLRLSLPEWGAAAGCALLALYVFMADALRALPGGAEAVANARPAAFNWLLLLAACLGAAGVLARVFRPARGRQH